MPICTSFHQKYPKFTPSLSNPNIKTFKTLSVATPSISRNRLFLRPITIERLPTKSLSSSSSSISSHGSFEELPPKLQEVIKLFQSVENSKAKYEQLLLYGKKLTPLDPRFRTPENKVQGCVNQLWVRADLESESDIVIYDAHSESELTKGLAALLVKGLSGLTVEEISQISSNFMVSLGLKLNPSKTNGFLIMFKFMQEKAKWVYLKKLKKEAQQLRKKKSDLGGENSVQDFLPRLRKGNVVVD